MNTGYCQEFSAVVGRFRVLINLPDEDSRPEFIET